MTDPIADMITRIKNAHLARHSQIEMPSSKIKAAIAKILQQAGYVEDVEVKDTKPQATLIIKLKYIGKIAAITQTRRISKPGRRIYTGSKNIPKTLGGYGITIVSTSKGVMTGEAAKKAKIGGEVLCQIW